MKIKVPKVKKVENFEKKQRPKMQRQDKIGKYERVTILETACILRPDLCPSVG